MRLLPAAAILGQLVAASAAHGQATCDASEDATPPKAGFLRTLGRDFVHVVAPSNLVIFGVGGAAALIAHPYDRQLTEDFHSSARLDAFFEAGDVAGGALVQGGGAVATWLAGKAFHSPKVADLGENLVQGQIINGALTLALKRITNRDRPDGTRWSFPSGHTSAAFTTATVLERHLGWKAGVPAYAAAAYIGASRLQENKHFISDVLFGAAVGMVSGRSATFDRGKQRASLDPLLVPGGFGGVLVVVGR